MDVIIGIDNGATGSVGIITPKEREYFSIPSQSVQDFTKKKQNVSRIDHRGLITILSEGLSVWLNNGWSVRAYVERPFKNPGSFSSSFNAARALESVLVILESLGIGYEFVDSKQWQKALLPAGVAGSAQLKKASKEIGIRLFPEFESEIKKQKDADGILIAEWAWRKSHD